MATVYFYGADKTDLSGAFFTVMALGVPASQITGDLSLAETWVSNAKPVIAVGGAALNNLLSSNSSWISFCNYSSWQTSASYGPIDGCGATGYDSLQITYALADNALNGTSISGIPTQCESCQ